jgi:hypothetical protein
VAEFIPSLMDWRAGISCGLIRACEASACFANLDVFFARSFSFHDVACRLAEIDLEEFGFETEWITWDFAGPEGETAAALGQEEGTNVWKDVRYDYWRLGNKYRCPVVRWKKVEQESK